ncbi:uncharacterized protein LOC143178309 [Calliopsis andreniformis]|uniref:uncharacterized protein LOC143178309 n=1 Tax=Calliopsis andreniformis TaxID=337506 RepID=UPI003FCC5509
MSCAQERKEARECACVCVRKREGGKKISGAAPWWMFRKGEESSSRERKAMFAECTRRARRARVCENTRQSRHLASSIASFDSINLSYANDFVWKRRGAGGALAARWQRAVTAAISNNRLPPSSQIHGGCFVGKNKTTDEIEN